VELLTVGPVGIVIVRSQRSLSDEDQMSVCSGHDKPLNGTENDVLCLSRNETSDDGNYESIVRHIEVPASNRRGWQVTSELAANPRVQYAYLFLGHAQAYQRAGHGSGCRHNDSGEASAQAQNQTVDGPIGHDIMLVPHEGACQESCR
jgi:hypothetical protein